MKNSAFLVLLPLLASTALAADPPQTAISDLLLTQLDSGKLTITPVNAPSDSDPAVSTRSLAVQLRGIPGSSSLQVSSNGQFALTSRRTDGNQNVTDYISISSSFSRITRTVQAIQTTDGNTRSTVVQQIMLSLPSSDGASSTTLRVIQDSKVVATFNEKSFADLWTKHPDEVRKYLMPLFDSLDLQGVFSIKPDEALHVFAPLLKGLPTVKAQIDALLPKLDDDSAAVRTAASDELDSIGANAVPIVSALDLKTQPLQTRIILKNFLDRMKNSHAVKDDRLENPDFLMLCLAVDDPQIPALAKKQLEKVTGKAIIFDEKASLADRQAAVEKLRLAAFAQQAP